MKRWAVLLMGVGLVFSAGAVPAPPTGQSLMASFSGLGFLSTVGFGSWAWDVSANGLAVTGGSFYSDWGQAFIWTAERGITPLPLMPGKDPNSDGDGLSADGSKVAGTCGWEFSGYEASVWSYDGAQWNVEGLGDLAGGRFDSHAYYMNPAATVIVGEANSDKGTEASRWMLEGDVWIIKGLGDLPKGAYWSQAYGASKDGSVVVGQGSIANGTRAFRWTSKGMVDLGTVAKRKYSAAWGCSEDGSVVVGESFSARGKDEIAFRWTAATGMVGLGDLPGGQVLSEAEATNADGSIVVGWSTTDLGMEAFIWDNANKMRRLTDVLSAQGVTDHNGWVLSSATGVTAVGDTLVIVGKGKNPDGNTEAWRAVIANY